MASTFKELGKSISDWSKEKVHQSKENHVLDLMIDLKDEGITFEQYREAHKNINELRKEEK